MAQTFLVKCSRVLLGLLLGPTWVGVEAIAAESGSVPSARLHYERAEMESLIECPDKAGLEGAVSAHLGVVPFVEPADLRISVTLKDSAEGLVAEVEIRDRQGKRGKRRLTSKDRDCRELAEALVLAIALAIDPLAPGPGDLRPEEGEGQAVRPVRPSPSPSPSPSASARRRTGTSTSTRGAHPDADAHAVVEAEGEVGVLLDVALGGAIGATPEVTWGVKISGGVVVGATFSFSLEGRFFGPADRIVSGRSGIRVARFGGAVVPCFRVGWLGLCGLFVGGVHQASGVNLENDESVLTPHVGVGGRLEAEPLTLEPFSILLGLEGTASLTRATLRVGPEAAWVTPDLAGMLLLGARYEVP